MAQAFAAFAKNPALGETPAVREPGEFGPYDESESHLFLGPFDKGAHEGRAIALGLKSPSEGLGDAVMDTWDNFKVAAKHSFQEIADYKAPPGRKTAFDTEGILSGRVPAALLLAYPNMLAHGIEGMAGLLENGTKDVKDSFAGGSVDKQRLGRGVSQILWGLAQVALGRESGDVAEGAVGEAGETLQARAPRAGNSILRATNERSFLYGKNPGRAFIDEPIRMTNSITNIAGQLSEAGDRLHDAVAEKLADPKIAKNSIDVDAALQPVFRAAFEDIAQQSALRNRGGIVAAIKILEDDVMNKHDIEGNTVQGPHNKMTPAEVNNLKRSVGKSAKWDVIPGAVDPEIAGYVNDIRQKVYGTLNDLIEQAAPGTKALNARYANVIEASRLIAKRIAGEEMADLGGRRLLSRGAWLYAVDALMHGEPLKAGTVAATQAMRSTLGRTVRPAAMDRMGRALQSPAGRAVAGAAGTAAGAIPAVSGAAQRVLAGEEAQ